MVHYRRCPPLRADHIIGGAKYTYRYDDQKRLVEENEIMSNGVTKDGKSSFVPQYATYRTIHVLLSRVQRTVGAATEGRPYSTSDGIHWFSGSGRTRFGGGETISFRPLLSKRRLPS